MNKCVVVHVQEVWRQPTYCRPRTELTHHCRCEQWILSTSLNILYKLIYFSHFIWLILRQTKYVSLNFNVQVQINSTRPPAGAHWQSQVNDLAVCSRGHAVLTAGDSAAHSVVITFEGNSRGPLGINWCAVVVSSSSFLLVFFPQLLRHDGASEGQMKASAMWFAEIATGARDKYLPLRGHFKDHHAGIHKWLFINYYFDSGWVRVIFIPTPIFALARWASWILRRRRRMFYLMPEGCVYRVDTSEWLIQLHREHLRLEK